MMQARWAIPLQQPCRGAPDRAQARNACSIHNEVLCPRVLSRMKQHGDEAGGLSGAPLTTRSTDVIAAFRQLLPSTIPIIGVGGIMSVDDAKAKLNAGAPLVQLYTGLVYRGPKLITDIAKLPVT